MLTSLIKQEKNKTNKGESDHSLNLEIFKCDELAVKKPELTDNRNASELFIPGDILQHFHTFGHWQINFREYNIDFRSLRIQSINDLPSRTHGNDCQQKENLASVK